MTVRVHACRIRPDCLGSGLAIIWTICLVGCISPVQEKARLFNDDGVAMFQKGDFLSARESFAIALELSPQDPDLLYNLAECYHRLGNYSRAETLYVQCLQLQAGYSDARYSLGMLYYKTGRAGEFKKLVDEWFVDRPGDPEPYVLDAWRLRQEKNFPQAQGRLQQALGLSPTNIHALTEMGVLYEMMNLPDRSLALYERALIQNPNQPEILARVQELRSRNVGNPLPVD